MSAQSDLVTEADVIRTLEEGTYTLQALYEQCFAAADIARDRGLEPPDAEHPTDRVWRRRVRDALQTLRATRARAPGLRERMGDTGNPRAPQATRADRSGAAPSSTSNCCSRTRSRCSPSWRSQPTWCSATRPMRSTRNV